MHFHFFGAENLDVSHDNSGFNENLFPNHKICTLLLFIIHTCILIEACLIRFKCKEIINLDCLRIILLTVRELTVILSYCFNYYLTIIFFRIL